MRVLVSLAKPEGGFHEVGMNNQAYFGPYSERYLVRLANEYAKGRYARLQWFVERLIEEPFKTTYINKPQVT